MVSKTLLSISNSWWHTF